MILGAVFDVEFHRASTSFEPGAVLVMYSDGVLERQNGNEEFGLARLEELVIRHQQESAFAILNAIYQTILAFGDQAVALTNVDALAIHVGHSLPAQFLSTQSILRHENHAVN
jgi:hypothetical protein